MEPVEKEINVSLQGIGLSLVNDQQRREIAYMAISRSAFWLLPSTLSVCLNFMYSSLERGVLEWAALVWKLSN